MLVLAILALLLTACGAPSEPSQAAIDAAKATIVAGATALSTVAVPTAVLLADVDLEPLILQPGDLPSGFQGGQVRDSVPNAFKGVPDAAQTFYQIIEQTGSSAGNIVILLYTDTNRRNEAYDVMKESGEDAHPTEGIGEQANVYVGTRDLPVRSVTFVRCHAAVTITLGKVDVDTVTNYAKRLDKRLQQAVCS